MWYNPKKWRPDSVEARVHDAAARAALDAGESGEDVERLALDAVFEVVHWLFSNSYETVVEMVLEKWAVATSETALGGLYQRLAGPWAEERARRNSAAAMKLRGQIDREGMSEAILDELAQMTFEMLQGGGESNPGMVLKFARLIHDARKDDRGFEVDNRKLTLAEEKARDEKALRMDEVSEKVKAAKERGGLSDEMLAYLEGELNLI